MTTESRMREALEEFESFNRPDYYEEGSYDSGYRQAMIDAAARIREALSPPARRTSCNGETFDDIVKAEFDLDDRLRALESLVRAADRMRSSKRRHWSSDFHETQESFDAATNAMNAYDTQRAAVGEIEEE